MSYPAIAAEMAGMAVWTRLSVRVLPVTIWLGSTVRAAAIASRVSSLGERAPRSMALIMGRETKAARARSACVIRRARRMVATRRPTSRAVGVGIRAPFDTSISNSSGVVTV